MSKSDILEEGIHYKTSYIIIVSDGIISLGIGYPSDGFKKQLLGEIIKQALGIFEQYIKQKGVA